MSTPTTRSTLNERKEFIRLPRGCNDCFTREVAHYGVCEHENHFEAIKTKIKDMGYSRIGAGSFRYTYSRDNSRYVVKIPQSHDGYCDNYFEALAWMERDRLFSTKTIHDDRLRTFTTQREHIGNRVARCSLLPNGLLVMEKLKDPSSWAYDKSGCFKADPTMKEDPAMPMLFNMDGGQGGFDREGRFRLYDYTHRAEIDSPFTNMEAL